jgi:effector-binding domain-containing protein
MRLLLAATLAILTSLTSTIADEPKPAPAHENSPVSLGDMRIQTVPSLTYLYIPVDETSFDKMGDPIKDGFDKLFAAASEAKLLIARPTMLVYPKKSPHFHPDKPFPLEIGIIVSDDTQPVGDCKLRKTDPFKCATLLYTGPVDQQGRAYEKLIPALKAAGHTPTGEEREMCLYWEGLDSPNNVFFMQIGIK